MNRTQMTATIGKTLRVGILAPATPYLPARAGEGYSGKTRVSILTGSPLSRFTVHAAAALALIALSGCAGNSITPGAPRNNAVCLALQPAMPIQYSGKGDTPETVRQVKQANARFQAACVF